MNRLTFHTYYDTVGPRIHSFVSLYLPQPTEEFKLLVGTAFISLRYLFMLPPEVTESGRKDYTSNVLVSSWSLIADKLLS